MEKTIFTNMCLIVEGTKALVIQREGTDWPGITFPGGEVKEGESFTDAMIRETREEAGLVVIPESVREYGYVHRIQKSDSDPTECFVQDNFYYLCDALDDTVSQELDNYEAKENYRLEFVDPQSAIRKNRSAANTPYNRMMFEREARVLELLIAEGHL